MFCYHFGGALMRSKRFYGISFQSQSKVAGTRSYIANDLNL